MPPRPTYDVELPGVDAGITELHPTKHKLQVASSQSRAVETLDDLDATRHKIAVGIKEDLDRFMPCEHEHKEELELDELQFSTTNQIKPALVLTSTGSLKLDKRRSQECGKESQE